MPQEHISFGAESDTVLLRQAKQAKLYRDMENGAVEPAFLELATESRPNEVDSFAELSSMDDLTEVPRQLAKKCVKMQD